MQPALKARMQGKACLNFKKVDPDPQGIRQVSHGELVAVTRKVCLIHWNPAESVERAERLRAAGYETVFLSLKGAGMRGIRENPPDAMVIDLSRIPSHGRDVALSVRMKKSTRRMPLVFVDGDPEKVARVKLSLPDAVYTTWAGIRAALKHAIAHPPEAPVVPGSALAGYSGTPLPRKLGIKPGATVALVGAPPDFAATLGDLPEGVTMKSTVNGNPDLAIWFTRSRNDLMRRIGAMASRTPKGGLWIAWPKKTSALASDLSEATVRETGLAAGLVDYKICAVDATWSGLKFARRKPSS
jgi:hypothetical protein